MYELFVAYIILYTKLNYAARVRTVLCSLPYVNRGTSKIQPRYSYTTRINLFSMPRVTFSPLEIALCRTKTARKVPALAGDPEVSGTCRNRQTWVPQAWKDAEAECGSMQLAPLRGNGDGRAQGQAPAFDDASAVRVRREGGGGEEKAGAPGSGGVGGAGGGDGGATGGGGGQDLLYDLLAVVVHRGSAYSGHYHALIRDCLQEVRSVARGYGAFVHSSNICFRNFDRHGAYCARTACLVLFVTLPGVELR